MELPASYYGKIDKRNPVVKAFERDISSVLTRMRRAASSSYTDSSSYAKGIKSLLELWIKYKPRLPSKLYYEEMLRTADSLFELKLYQAALWHGYRFYLLQFSSLNITDITDVDQFMVCFFPEGIQADPDTLAMKIQAMRGCALCIFEQEKKPSVLNQRGLSKLLSVLNFIRIMLQAFQQHKCLCWHIFNGSLQMYDICRYLMTVNCSGQALEYLLYASISLELYVPLMTANLPWIVTLYCAVCHCYYDNQNASQAEKFARRALGKIKELAKQEEQSEFLTIRETQRVYKEASIKLDAMVFKRAVFETRVKPKALFKAKLKNTVKEIHTMSWHHTTAGRMLRGLFDSSAAHFFAILEALWDSTSPPLKTGMPEEPEVQEVILELLSAGITILSGVTATSVQTNDSCPSMSLSAVTPTSTLLDLAIAGENKVSIMSAVRFIKLLFRYKQPEAFTELAREMLQILSGVEGLLFRRAEQELTLLCSFNNLLHSQKRRHQKDSSKIDENRSFISDEFSGLVDALHKSVCHSAPEVQPNADLVLDIMIFVWDKLSAMRRKNLEFKHYTEKVDCNKWLWCMSLLCEIATVCDLASVDCVMMAKMVHMLALLLEDAAESFEHTHSQDGGGVKPDFSSLQVSSRTELFQMQFEVLEKGLKSLAKGVSALLPLDGSALTGSSFMLTFCPFTPLTVKLSEGNEGNKNNRGGETNEGSDMKGLEETQRLLVASDLYVELEIMCHRTGVKLLHLNAVEESKLLDQIKKNNVSKAFFLMQKALYSNAEPNKRSETKSLLEEASSLIKRSKAEERKLYSTSPKTPAKATDNRSEQQDQRPPPPPILLSRTAHSFTFAPAPYNIEGEVCWYQLCGRAVEGINQKVRLVDCNLLGTGNMVPAKSGDCVLKVEGLEPNQKYVFAIAAYNSQGKLLGNSIGETTYPLLASVPVPLMSAWAHLAKVAFQTAEYAIAKSACIKLWSHYTFTDSGSHHTVDRLAARRLHKQALRRSSPDLCRLLLTSMFIETEITIQQESLNHDSFSDKGPFIWEQDARLTECERMLVAMDLALWLNDGIAAVRAVVTCYGLLAPLIFHQITCGAVVEVLKKCLLVLEENSGLLKQKWTGNALESIMNIIACSTYYLSKALHDLREQQLASMVKNCGLKLLQELYSHMQIPTPASATPKKMYYTSVFDEKKISLQLKALHANEAAHTNDNEISQALTSFIDPTIFDHLHSSSSLKDAFQNVMKQRHKPYFIEYASQLLQKTLEHGHPDLVLEWGQSVFKFLCRRDEVIGLSTKYMDPNILTEKEPVENTNTSQRDTRKGLKQKLPRSLLKTVKTFREMLIVEKMLNMMAYVVHRSKKRIQLRNMCKLEGVWKAHIHYTMAQAHIALLDQGIDKLHGGALPHKYSRLNLLCFSLAYSGVLLPRTSQRPFKNETESNRDSSHPKDYVATHKNENEDEDRIDGSTTEDSYDEDDEEQDTAQPEEEHIRLQKLTATLVLQSLNKAVLHFRRAMVFAHRGRHWTTLQCVCHTVWDQSCKMAFFVQRASELEPPCVISAEQLHATFTPLLVLATDLIMDMLNNIGFWSLYDCDLTEEDLETSLQFSAQLDDSTQVDLRWVRTLVLHTLEQLHYSGKWESLAHFALLFNSYTRERYALIINPLLVDAQRWLLKRIGSYGGPSVPQPHHVTTQQATGRKVTCRSYAWTQLLSGWTAKQPHNGKKAELAKSLHNVVKLKGAEIQHSMANVCVPLDINDTLFCYRQAIERRSHCLQVFQHSRSLLLLLIAYTQPSFAVNLRHSVRSSSLKNPVDFSPIIMPTPNSESCDLTVKDFSSPNAVYSLPVSPDHIPTVVAAYSSSIKYLGANSRDSLRAVALHEMGNLQFYSGNMRAAESYWNAAIDCALKSAGTIDKWDGVSFGGDCLQQTLKQAGLWGCLQAAGLTAKIAQHILTSDISQRTKYCLLSAHLFKSVLFCSMAQPQADLQYASHTIRDELLPGVSLFSEPIRVHLETTVTSLNFICHWLLSAGYYITLLPLLALYLHFVGTLCRDIHRTVEGKILKIRALTELSLFTEAVKEAVQLTKGVGVPLPCGYYITEDSVQPMKMFCTNKSLLDNAEAVEELVNCDIAPEMCNLYGSTLCLRFNLARIQLVLALSNTIHGLPTQGSTEEENQDQDVCIKSETSKVLDLNSKKEKLRPKMIKFLLLEAASFLVTSSSQQLALESCSEIQNLELAIEINLLKANLYLQQGHAALSSDMAVTSLVLLQTSAMFTRQTPTDFRKPSSDLPQVKTETKKDLKDGSISKPLLLDCPSEVEASERTGILLWLRCRLALVHSMVSNITAIADIIPGKNINEEAARVIQEGLSECRRWGDLYNQAQLMVEGAELEAQRGRTEDTTAMLQEAVSLLTGQTFMPPGSVLTLARATLMLSKHNGPQCTRLQDLTQELLKKQLHVFGQKVKLNNEEMFVPSDLSNIYLPHLDMLSQTILQFSS